MWTNARMHDIEAMSEDWYVEPVQISDASKQHSVDIGTNTQKSYIVISN